MWRWVVGGAGVGAPERWSSRGRRARRRLCSPDPQELCLSDETETPETPETTETSPGPARRPFAPPTPLQRPTDAAARPGFRSPANNRSKAQKKKK